VDAKNCGACGKTCGAGEVCSKGACATSCAAGQTQCGASCVNAQTDDANCGSCGTVCAPGQACVGGKCDVTCLPTQTLCPAPPAPDGGSPDGGSSGPYCASLGSDNLNCGACGVACSNTTACNNGQCCPGGKVGCNGKCLDVSSDPLNCGGCGVVCASQTPNCSQGQCIAGLSIVVEGHANVIVNCNKGDYYCEAREVCNKVTGMQCVWQQYDCAFGNQGSWYPPDGQSGGSSFNFAYAYDLYSSDYGNICACTQSQMSKYGLAANHQYCGVGHWVRQ
jgi:hypothetical protein